mmetsp:Transcript_46167/g.98436  ORF Transcript_46167/g.98436 Transcript_46167/m.98436 type:complete len:209 (-) Transcript_46167:128-754(-)
MSSARAGESSIARWSFPISRERWPTARFALVARSVSAFSSCCSSATLPSSSLLSASGRLSRTPCSRRSSAAHSFLKPACCCLSSVCRPMSVWMAASLSAETDSDSALSVADVCVSSSRAAVCLVISSWSSARCTSAAASCAAAALAPTTSSCSALSSRRSWRSASALSARMRRTCAISPLASNASFFCAKELAALWISVAPRPTSSPI